MEFLPQKYKRYAPNRKILITRSEVKVTDTRIGMCDTPSSQDAFRHQIWNSYLKEYGKYAPDSMQFLEIRSGQVQGHSDQIMVHKTSPYQDAFTHQI